MGGGGGWGEDVGDQPELRSHAAFMLSPKDVNGGMTQPKCFAPLTLKSRIHSGCFIRYMNMFVD